MNRLLKQSYLAVFIAMGASYCLTSCDDKETSPELPSETTIYEGLTTTWPVEDPEDIYESRQGTYQIAYNETEKTAVLTITSPSFIQGMPAGIVMDFPTINWTFANKENILLLQKDNLIPEVMGRPFKQYAISNFTATENPGKTLHVEFICTFEQGPQSPNLPPMTVRFEGTAKK